MRNTLKVLVESNRFDRVLQQVSHVSTTGEEVVDIKSASKGRLTAHVIVTKEMTNWSDRLHGGMTATLVDQLSSLALTTALVTPEQQREGVFAKVNSVSFPFLFAKVNSVSLDLSITYLNGVQLGDTLLIEANALKCGKNIAFLSVDVFNQNTNQLVANGKHTKYLLNK
ncbi:unnamed protein product [Medioppia subpectinata]|uniref:Thioesterase domain-containing protein n=1 Tax=Medioppia subpectinata TaxID=1979941 RepID=A0A7R9L9A0_9ACAR|nr:unnamed protein product [Medioppia subpectinata]CAG2116640.1 unnamed protein product [Medioppia subpectinata]